MRRQKKQQKIIESAYKQRLPFHKRDESELLDYFEIKKPKNLDNLNSDSGKDDKSLSDFNAEKLPPIQKHPIKRASKMNAPKVEKVKPSLFRNRTEEKEIRKRSKEIKFENFDMGKKV